MRYSFFLSSLEATNVGLQCSKIPQKSLSWLGVKYIGIFVSKSRKQMEKNVNFALTQRINKAFKIFLNYSVKNIRILEFWRKNSIQWYIEE